MARMAGVGKRQLRPHHQTQQALNSLMTPTLARHTPFLLLRAGSSPRASGCRGGAAAVTGGALLSCAASAAPAWVRAASSLTSRVSMAWHCFSASTSTAVRRRLAGWERCRGGGRER